MKSLLQEKRLCKISTFDGILLQSAQATKFLHMLCLSHYNLIISERLFTVHVIKQNERDDTILRNRLILSSTHSLFLNVINGCGCKPAYLPLPGMNVSAVEPAVGRIC